MSRVLKYAIPVDDQSHQVSAGITKFLHVACQFDADEVQVWAQVHEGMGDVTHLLQVFGTGQQVPNDAEWVGSTVTAGGHLVWHLFDVTHVQ